MKRILFLILGILFFSHAFAQEKYGVIVGSTLNINKAFMLRSCYLDLGFSETEVLIQKGGPNYRVCIGVYDSKHKAISFRNKNRKKYKIPYDSWLLKIYDYKKSERKELRGELEGKTVTILDSTKIEEVKLRQKSLEEKYLALDSSLQEMKSFNLALEKKLADLEKKQKENGINFNPVWEPVDKNSLLGQDFTQNMTVYGLLGGNVATVDPARIMFGTILGSEYNFYKDFHALLEFQLFWQADRKINILGGVKYDFYNKANIMLSSVVKLGYANIQPDGPGKSKSAFIFQFGFAPEVRLKEELSLYIQMLYSGTAIDSSLDDDIIGVVGVKYYF